MRVSSTFQLNPKIAKKLSSESKRLDCPKVKLVHMALEEFFQKKRTKLTVK